MCRHRVRLGLSRMPAELLFDPPHGLYRHSWEPRRQRHGTVNLDGFRIGWYQPGGYRLPARYRRAILIWTDGNLPDLARSVHTCAVLAAVRDATSGTSRDEAASAGRGTGLGSFGTSPPYGPTAWLNLLLAEGHTITATRWGDTLGYRATEDHVVASEPVDGAHDWQGVREREILIRRAGEIARLTRARALVELGSGASENTRLLLDALTTGGTLEQYAPVDVSFSALVQAGEALCRDYPTLRVTSTVTDFETDPALPPSGTGPRLIAVLGSTIGNLDSARRGAFYTTLRGQLDHDDALLLGADLVKDPATFVRAYGDEQGVTAAFNLNVLRVLNRELGADFDTSAFTHHAVWNKYEERVEMRLRSSVRQTVRFSSLDLSVDFAMGDDSFEQDVLMSDKPVLVDFWAAWCGPCRQIAPALEAIAADYDNKIEVVKLNIDENPVTAA
jgi:dimethylhistidine N-methyltransferase